MTQYSSDHPIGVTLATLEVHFIHNALIEVWHANARTAGVVMTIRNFLRRHRCFNRDDYQALIDELVTAKNTNQIAEFCRYKVRPVYCSRSSTFIELN